jgi:transposase-like protein
LWWEFDGVQKMGIQYKSEFKTKIALIALKEEMTIAEIAKEYSVPPGVVNRWKREATESACKCFTKNSKAKKEAARTERKIAALERKVGQLTIDNEFLKKNYEKYTKS